MRNLFADPPTRRAVASATARLKGQMKSFLSYCRRHALILSIGFGALTLFQHQPRIDAARQAANTAQSSANAAMVRSRSGADDGQWAHDLAGMANSKAEAALAARSTGNAVCHCCRGAWLRWCLGLFGVGLFVSWDLA